MAEGTEAVQEVTSTTDEEAKDQKVTPWEAHAAEGHTTIDYGKLISESVAPPSLHTRVSHPDPC